MEETRENLLADIDATLDQLTETAEALRFAKQYHHFDHEIELLERSQESLLARLMHRQSILELDDRKTMLSSLKKEEITREKNPGPRSNPISRKRSFFHQKKTDS